MRIAQEGGFASDEETLDPCTYRLVHMFRTMLNSKIQAGVPFNCLLYTSDAADD